MRFSTIFLVRGVTPHFSSDPLIRCLARLCSAASHLLQRFLLHLRDCEPVEEDPQEGDHSVGPEGSVKPEYFPQINECLDSEEGAEVTEGRGEGSAESSELQREDLAQEEPGDRRKGRGCPPGGGRAAAGLRTV